MSSFWQNFHHWVHRKLSKWQPLMKISSKWRHSRFIVRCAVYTMQYFHGVVVLSLLWWYFRFLFDSSHQFTVPIFFRITFIGIGALVSMLKCQWTWWHHQMETFSALLAVCAGNSPVTGEFPAQRPALMFSLICVWINGWVNNREAGHLKRYRAHYDVIVMANHRYISHDALYMHVTTSYILHRVLYGLEIE